MDTVLLSVLLGAVVFGLMKCVSFLVRHIQRCRKLSKLPQLPSHWLMGNLDLVGDADSYGKLCIDMAQKGHRVFCLWIGPFPLIVVCHPKTIKQVVQNAAEKPKGPGDGYNVLQQWIGDGLIISNGQKWERNRKMLTPAFHFDILKGYIPVMNRGADTLLNKLWEHSKYGSSVEVMERIRKHTLDVILRCSLSYDADIQNDQKEDHPYLVAVRRLGQLSWERMLSPLLYPDFIFKVSKLGREFQKHAETSRAFTGGIIRQRKMTLEQGKITGGKRHLDFLDILLTARDNEGVGLSDQEIQHEVDTFTFAGHDTTMSAISWSIHALAKYPDIQEQVYQDVNRVLGDSEEVTMEALSQMDYLSNFLKEVLRYYSIAQFFSRRITKPFSIDGAELPEGCSVDIAVKALHHNPEIWPDHMEFHPERFERHQGNDTEPYSYIPFSIGSRNCIGKNFAMNEIKVTIAKFVQRFQVSLDPKKEVIPTDELVLSTKTGIWVVLRERQR